MNEPTPSAANLKAAEESKAKLIADIITICHSAHQRSLIGERIWFCISHYHQADQEEVRKTLQTIYNLVVTFDCKPDSKECRRCQALAQLTNLMERLK